MIEIPTLTELREIRRRLSEEHKGDIASYARMLRKVAKAFPGEYVVKPILPGFRKPRRRKRGR